MYGLCRTYHMFRNHFGCTQWNCFVMWVMWNLVSVHLETLLILGRLDMLDRCIVCA
jgi:hypothetical protein